MENMTLSDIAAVTGSKEQDDLFGGNGFFAIIILFFIFAMFGGGFGMNGFGNAAAQGALTRAELADGFNTATLERNQNNLMRDQFGMQREIMENRFAQQQCCCTTQQNILQNRYDAALGNAATQREILDSRYNTALGFQTVQAQAAECLKRIANAIRRFFAPKNAVGTCAA